jgi:hypothetical protein
MSQTASIPSWGFVSLETSFSPAIASFPKTSFSQVTFSAPVTSFVLATSSFQETSFVSREIAFYLKMPFSRTLWSRSFF